MNKGPIKIEWFIGGETNLCYNAVDRHVKNGLGGKVAFLYEGKGHCARACCWHPGFMNRFEGQRVCDI